MLAIMATLIAVTLAVGSSVVRGGKGARTRDAIRVLEQVLGDYSTGIDGMPEPVLRLPADVAEYERDERNLVDIRHIPIADARWEARGGVMLNSGGLFVAQARQAGYGSGIEGLDAKLIAQYSPEPNPATVSEAEAHPSLATVMDGWNRPIRYVHPVWDGQIVSGMRAAGDAGSYVEVSNNDEGYLYDGTNRRQKWIGDADKVLIRRNRILESEFEMVAEEDRDSDGGVCVNAERPYFYSAGADGDPATIEDNIYTQDPRFAEVEQP
ncbi:MAG: hypothetical protein DHS20C14_02560 [Phycisphaeraceae bacterium]|nr:MAG: hypothetical protein DHS20C14_02560 [Phycisphaeraceae bacterium]